MIVNGFQVLQYSSMIPGVPAPNTKPESPHHDLRLITSPVSVRILPCLSCLACDLFSAGLSGRSLTLLKRNFLLSAIALMWHKDRDA